MTKKKKIFCIAFIAFLVSAWLLCNLRITRNALSVTESIYTSASCGGYDYFCLNMGYGNIISGADYQTIASGINNILDTEQSPTETNWNIKSVHSLFYVQGAYSYVHDICTVTGGDGTVFAKYDRHIRLHWKRNKEDHRYELADIEINIK